MPLPMGKNSASSDTHTSATSELNSQGPMKSNSLPLCVA